jgi:hypothetical protein
VGERSLVERRVGVIDMTNITSMASTDRSQQSTTSSGENAMNQHIVECAFGASWI